MKKILLAAVFVCMLATPAAAQNIEMLLKTFTIAAVTANDLTPTTLGFIVNANSADYSGCEELKAAVTGKSIHIERVFISSDTALNITIGAGETGGAVTGIILGPVYFAANTSREFVFTKPIKLDAAVALTCDASGAGNVTVIVQGFIK